MVLKPRTREEWFTGILKLIILLYGRMAGPRFWTSAWQSCPVQHCLRKQGAQLVPPRTCHPSKPRVEMSITGWTFFHSAWYCTSFLQVNGHFGEPMKRRLCTKY